MRKKYLMSFNLVSVVSGKCCISAHTFLYLLNMRYLLPQVQYFAHDPKQILVFYYQDQLKTVD
jgi:hypothetical protein